MTRRSPYLIWCWRACVGHRTLSESPGSTTASIPEEFAPRNGQHGRTETTELTVGFAGRLAPGKGLDVLIRAIAAAREHVSLRLRVAGDGPERARAESLAAAVGVADAIDFLGMVDDVAAFWHRCDLAIVPDTWVESFCIAAVEAMLRQARDRLALGRAARNHSATASREWSSLPAILARLRRRLCDTLWILRCAATTPLPPAERCWIVFTSTPAHVSMLISSRL